MKEMLIWFLPSLSDASSSLLVSYPLLLLHDPSTFTRHSLARTRLITTTYALITEYDDRLAFYFQHTKRTLFYIEIGECENLHEDTIRSLSVNTRLNSHNIFLLLTNNIRTHIYILQQCYYLSL